jgi:hypothetical protein
VRLDILGARNVPVEILFDAVATVMRAHLEIEAEVACVLACGIARRLDVLRIDVQRVGREFRTRQIVHRMHGAKIDPIAGERGGRLLGECRHTAEAEQEKRPSLPTAFFYVRGWKLTWRLPLRQLP